MEIADEKYNRRLKIVAAMRVVILIAGFYQLFFGEFEIGLCIILSLLAISLPAFFTRNLIKTVPLEFELVLFAMVVLQFVIGETLNFYENVPYFDKFVHFTIPLFLGYITSILTYTMVATGNLRIKPAPAFVLIILVTLGIGAIWEVFEYLCDVLLGTYLQGSITANPLTDTMNDLIVDTLGGIFGATLAFRYIRSEMTDDKSRLSDLTGELAESLSIPQRKV